MRSSSLLLWIAVALACELVPLGATAADAPPSTFLVDDARRRIAERDLEAGRNELRAGALAPAAARLLAAHELAPELPAVALALADLALARKDPLEEQRWLREAVRLDPVAAPTRLRLAEALASGESGPDALAEAEAQLAALEDGGAAPLQVQLLRARVAAARGDLDEAIRHLASASAAAPSAALFLELGDLERAAGRSTQARKAWEDAVRAGAGAEAARRSAELEAEERARALGFSARAAEADAARLLLASRQASARGRPDEAERLASAAIAAAPASAEARLLSGELALAAGRVEEAELSLLRASALAPDAAAPQARLGELYLASPDRAPQAAAAFGRALALAPEHADLQLRRAEALRRAGDLPGALAATDRYLAIGGAQRTEALALRGALAAAVGTGAAPVPAGAGQAPQAAALERARAALERAAPESALAALSELEPEARGPEVLELQARILVATGRGAEAIPLLARAAALEPGRAELSLELGRLLSAGGRAAAAREQLARAEALGSTAAVLELASLDAAGGGGLLADLTQLGALLSAHERLTRLAGSGTGPIAIEAVARLVPLDGRLRALQLAAASAGAALALALVAVAIRRATRKTLAQLVASRPEAGPELQQAVASLRHELLKHGAFAITGLVETLDSGGDPAGAVAHAAALVNAADPLAGRLRRAVAELERLALARNVRLATSRDPLLSALLRGAAALERLGRLLASGPGPELLAAAAEARRQLVDRADPAARLLLETTPATELDGRLLLSVWERVHLEPAFVGAAFSTPELGSPAPGTVEVSWPLAALEELVANLIRNALQATLRDGPAAAATVGLAVLVELDSISGRELAVIVVQDRASGGPPTLPATSGGLSLVSALLARHGGALEVRPAANGFTKAVAVLLPRLERAAIPRLAA